MAHFITAKKSLRTLLAVATSGLMTATGLASIAGAQSPAPNHIFYSENPPNIVSGHPGYTVEVVDYGCSGGPSVSSIESSAAYYVSRSINTWIAITPEWAPGEFNCNTQASIESLISTLISYLEAHYPSQSSNYWQGIMLDEEPWFVGTSSPSSLTTSYNQMMSLNSWVQSQVVSTPGVTWWANEIGTAGGWWSQSQYNNLISGSDPAPQIYNSFMKGVANASGATYTLVTWDAGEAYPYNSESYVTGQIAGTPFQAYNSNGALCNWDNQFA
jgi:hypothetical protein